jgi:HD superfamily phosphohydrolase
MSRRVYHDPLHGAIELDRHDAAEALVIELVDTEPFQRLRRIRQLGPAFLTFHGAESSRFTHSLGVLHVARRAMAHLQRHDAALQEHRSLLYAAALLHDLGHGPLSHSGEEMYGLQHERWSARVIREHAGLRQRLDHHHPDLAERTAALLERGQGAPAAITALVSSQLDCDRLDYLLRDSYSTGTRYGQLDLERILSSLTLAPDGSVAIHPRGLMAVEHYLVVRNLMYRSVYNHRLNVVCNWLLSRTIATARQLGPGAIWADRVMALWLWHPEELTVLDFLANDDIRTGYHLQRWAEEGPPALAELCRRLIERRLLKATDVSDLSSQERLALLARARSLSEAAGMSPDHCCGLHQQQNQGYHPYKGGLRLWDGRRLQALEQRSALVQSLIEPTHIAWLIHPAEVSEALRRQLA